MKQTDFNERLHGIDALRAIAMILGIFLHATIAYKVDTLPTWPHDDVFTNKAFDFVYLLIHSFRMPLFFLIAGFFCRFLLLKIGEKEFIRHRWKRIVIPFGLSLIFILPFTIYPFLLYKNSDIYAGDWGGNFAASFKQLFQWNGMAHLWFLYYLIIYYFIIIVLRYISRLLRMDKLINSFYLFWRTINTGVQLLFIITVIVTAIILLNSQELFLSVDTGVIPGLLYLTFFGLFFWVGWMIHVNPKIFEHLKRMSWYLLIAGLLLSGFTFYLEFIFLPLKNESEYIILYKIIISFQVVLLVFGVIGVFLKYFKREIPFWRYISDASYWMYLLHLGLVAGLQIFCIQFKIPGILRFPFILFATLAITLISYKFWVRYTLIGAYLHGPRMRKSNVAKR